MSSRQTRSVRSAPILPAPRTRLSASYLIALGARIVSEVGDLWRRAREADKRLATLAVDTEIRFRSAADCAAFPRELTVTITSLVARYHDEKAPGGTLASTGARRAPRAERLCRKGAAMPVKKAPSGHRSVEAEFEVPGTPEEVWQAIATGPGISSWFVPTEIEQHAGGSAISHFGPGNSMDSVATITARACAARNRSSGRGGGATGKLITSSSAMAASRCQSCAFNEATR
jgi:hypothetical protein